MDDRERDRNDRKLHEFDKRDVAIEKTQVAFTQMVNMIARETVTLCGPQGRTSDL